MIRLVRKLGTNTWLVRNIEGKKIATVKVFPTYVNEKNAWDVVVLTNGLRGKTTAFTDISLKRALTRAKYFVEHTYT